MVAFFGGSLNVHEGAGACLFQLTRSRSQPAYLSASLSARRSRARLKSSSATASQASDWLVSVGNSNTSVASKAFLIRNRRTLRLGRSGLGHLGDWLSSGDRRLRRRQVPIRRRPQQRHRHSQNCHSEGHVTYEVDSRRAPVGRVLVPRHEFDGARFIGMHPCAGQLGRPGKR
jgi:hypothetical protein